jgi:alanine racemase
MDWTMIELTDIPEAAIGDEVVVLGRQGEKEIRAEEMADRVGTISYEIFCNFSPRVPRVYIDGA